MPTKKQQKAKPLTSKQRYEEKRKRSTKLYSIRIPHGASTTLIEEMLANFTNKIRSNT
jgi:hypothetical protein